MVAGVVTGARTFYYLLVIVGAYLMLAKTRDVSLEKKALLLCLMIAVVAVVASPLGQSMIDSLTFQDIVSSRDIKRQLAIEQFGNSPVLASAPGSTLFTRLRLACRPTPVFTERTHIMSMCRFFARMDWLDLSPLF